LRLEVELAISVKFASKQTTTDPGLTAGVFSLSVHRSYSLAEQRTARTGIDDQALATNPNALNFARVDELVSFRSSNAVYVAESFDWV
jgi:hypothetical protein